MKELASIRKFDKRWQIVRAVALGLTLPPSVLSTFLTWSWGGAPLWYALLCVTFTVTLCIRFGVIGEFAWGRRPLLQRISSWSWLPIGSFVAISIALSVTQPDVDVANLNFAIGFLWLVAFENASDE